MSVAEMGSETIGTYHGDDDVTADRTFKCL